MKCLRKSVFLLFISVVAVISCDLHISPTQQELDQELLKLLASSSLDENVVKIYGIDQSQIIHEVQDGWENAWAEEKKNGMKKDNYLDPGDELCRGGGISFARCVRNAVDDGKCVKVYKDEDEYVGEEIAC